MSEYTRRALRAVVAAAAMATIGMSLIGTAAAAPHSPNNNIDSHSSTDNRQSTSATSDDGPSDSAPTDSPLNTDKGTPTPGVHNKLMNVEVPKVTTASYHGSWGTLAAEDSDQSDADNPPADSMLSHNPQGDLSQSGDAPSTDTLLGVTKAPAPSGGLNQMNGYQLGTSKV
ncbi:MAG TPA: hypothetical protein VNP03_04130 [Pseudonocardia sp.]|nr:hypothetical protein [Pseudonocardia sp.]